jgi:hypothetical protein
MFFVGSGKKKAPTYGGVEAHYDRPNFFASELGGLRSKKFPADFGLKRLAKVIEFGELRRHFLYLSASSSSILTSEYSPASN